MHKRAAQRTLCSVLCDVLCSVAKSGTAAGSSAMNAVHNAASLTTTSCTYCSAFARRPSSLDTLLERVSWSVRGLAFSGSPVTSRFTVDTKPTATTPQQGHSQVTSGAKTVKAGHPTSVHKLPDCRHAWRCGPPLAVLKLSAKQTSCMKSARRGSPRCRAPKAGCAGRSTLAVQGPRTARHQCHPLLINSPAAAHRNQHNFTWCQLVLHDRVGAADQDLPAGTLRCHATIGRSSHL